jgi:hypothetical protein
MTAKENTTALRTIVIFIVAAIAILASISWAEAGGRGNISLLKAAHNAYDEGDPDTLDTVFQEALDLEFYNVELDVMVDITHTTYVPLDHPDYLQGKVRLYVKHDCVPDPGTRDLYKYFEDIAAMVAANNNSVYGDGRNVVLNIDVKPCNSLDYMDVVESLDALFDHYQDMLSYVTIGDAGSFNEQAVTMVLTSGDEPKDAYYNLINGGDKTLRAFKDRVVGGGDAYQNNVEDYFSGEADEYHRFYAMHWKHVEDGFPGSEGNWSQEDQDRLELLLSTASNKGFRIRFYALNGSPGSYQFGGGLGDAAQRWVQFVGANEGSILRHFVATDDRQQITDLFSDFVLPVRKLNDRVQRPDGTDQNGINPGVALADNQWIVEVHKSENNDYLWYSVGVVQSGWSIDWKTNVRINVNGSDKQGVTPDVTISPIGPPVVVQVNKSQNNDYLWYNLGQLDGSNTITWHTNGRIEVDGSHKQGVDPSVAIYNERVIQVNKSQNNDNLWYNTGEISGTQVIWGYNAQVDFQEGYNADVALEGDRVIVVFEGTDSYLHYSTGTLGSTSIVSWEQTGDIGGQQGNNPTIALGSDDTVIEMHTSPTTSKIWVSVGELQWPDISWKHNFVWDSGIGATPRVAFDANENLLIDVHKSGINDGLWVNVGKIGISAYSVYLPVILRQFP